MNATLPSSLDAAALALRLVELVGDERTIQVEFLLHLDEFDRRRAYLEAGFGSLWDYCLRSLHLREGAAGRRIGAMRVLRRFPRLEAALRDGRLCVSTAPLLGQVLTEENFAELVERAAYKTKAEVEHLVVTIRPRVAPTEGIRRLYAPAAAASSAETRVESATPLSLLDSRTLAAPSSAPLAVQLAVAVAAPPAPQPMRARSTDVRPADVRPVSEDQWSVRVTLDAAAKAELESLKALLSHKIPDGDLGAVLREAIRCGIEKHGNRKGADRKGASAPAQHKAPRLPTSREVDRPAHPAALVNQDAQRPRASTRIPAAIRREVWKRDGGRCTFEGPDGHRCGSRWQLELDHILSVALGGTSTVENLRLRCRAHNMLHAEQVYGREHMDRFRRAGLTIAGDSSSTVRVGEPSSRAEVVPQAP